MTDPTLDTLTHRLDRLERETLMAIHLTRRPTVRLGLLGFHPGLPGGASAARGRQREFSPVPKPRRPLVRLSRPR